MCHSTLLRHVICAIAHYRVEKKYYIITKNNYKYLYYHLLDKFDFSSRRSNDVITIGYMSNDFLTHATMFLIYKLFELHDRVIFQSRWTRAIHRDRY